MSYVHIVAVLAVLQYLVFGALVGRARGRFGVRAPATTGHEQFDREFRVQMNTLEQLVAFLPALLLANLYWPDPVVAAVGAVYLVGRIVYRQAYIANPSKRGTGFLLTIFPTFALLLATLVAAITRGTG